jgi:hypothetical protein
MPQYKITAPNTDYTGVSAGVPFAAGVGYTEDEVIVGWFEEHGYEVEEVAPPVPPNPVHRALPDLRWEDVSAEKLREAAENAGLDYDGLDKAGLVELLTEALGDGDTAEE